MTANPLPDHREPQREVVHLTPRQLENVLGQLLESQEAGRLTVSLAQLNRRCDVLATKTPAGVELEQVDDLRQAPISDQFPILQPFKDMGKGLE